MRIRNVFVTLLLLAGCGARSATDGSLPPSTSEVSEVVTTSPEHPSAVGSSTTDPDAFDPTVPVIMLGYSGGGAFCGGYLDLGVSLAIYADGTVIDLDGCSPYTASTTGRIDLVPLISELDEYFASDVSMMTMDDFLDLGYDIADVGTSELSYQDSTGAHHFVSAYALGYEPRDLMPADELAARDQLSAVTADIYAAVAPAAEPWSPSGLIVTRIDDLNVDTSTPAAWPLAPTPELLAVWDGPTGACTTVTGVDLAGLLPVVSAPYPTYWWSLGDQARGLKITPVIPGVIICATTEPATTPETTPGPITPGELVTAAEPVTPVAVTAAAVPPAEPITTPADPIDSGAPIVTVSFVDGYWCQGSTGPSYAVYADGTVISVGGCGQVDQSTIGRIDVAGLRGLLDELVASGAESLVMDEFENNPVYDVGSTVIDYRDIAEVEHRFTAFALGDEPPTGLSDAERRARAQLQAIVDSLWKLSPTEPWVPAAVTVTMSFNGGYPDQPAQPWPLHPTPELDALWSGPEGTCITVSGSDVGALIDVLPGTDSMAAGQWSLEGEPVMLFVNAVLPGYASGCP